MKTIEQEGIDVCNGLIRACQDAANGYRTSAESVEAGSLKQFLMDLAEQREFMVSDLQGEIVSLGTEPTEGGTVLGAFHREWVELTAGVFGAGDRELMSQSVESDRVCQEAYRRALQHELPRLTRDLLAEHYERLSKEYLQLRQLEAVVP